MEVASLLLLATASLVLLGAMVRCCCRYLYIRTMARRIIDDELAEDLDPSQLSDEEVDIGLAPLHANSTTKNDDGAVGDGHENNESELPAYVDVVNDGNQDRSM